MSTVEDFQPTNWQVSSNEALKISLIEKDESAGAIQFHPAFTYPIFGEEEMIYGFKDLVIHLVFDSITYKPFLNVKYSEKLNDEVDAQKDIIKKISDFLPTDDLIIKDEVKWIDSFMEERKSFQVPSSGVKIGEYTKDNEQYGVYEFPLGRIIKENSNDPIIQFWRRFQTFTILYIEAATYINLEDESNWVVYLTFNEQDKNCIGFCTTYKYWDYTNGKDFDLNKEHKFKARISQFLILPPYQNKGHGSELYKVMFQHWNNDKTISEITVEDPNESFDDLRDRNDLELLYNSGFFNELPSSALDSNGFLVTDSWITEKQKSYKLEKRQFNRLLEMIMLYEKQDAFYELQVKRRIYLKNYESLCDIEDEDDRKKAIDDSYKLVTEDYQRILSICNFLKQ